MEYFANYKFSINITQLYLNNTVITYMKFISNV